MSDLERQTFDEGVKNGTEKLIAGGVFLTTALYTWFEIREDPTKKMLKRLMIFFVLVWIVYTDFNIKNLVSIYNQKKS